MSQVKTHPEVLPGDSERVQNLGINRFLVQVDHVHLLTNLLHGSLGTERSNIGTDVTVGFRGNLLKVDIVREFHVAGVDAEDLETAGRVGNANVDFTIESTETTKSRVDRVGPVGGSHHDDVGAGLETVHEREQLRNDTTLDFAVGLFTLGSDGVDFIDEDNGGRVLRKEKVS